MSVEWVNRNEELVVVTSALSRGRGRLATVEVFEHEWNGEEVLTSVEHGERLASEVLASCQEVEWLTALVLRERAEALRASRWANGTAGESVRAWVLGEAALLSQQSVRAARAALVLACTT